MKQSLHNKPKLTIVRPKSCYNSFQTERETPDLNYEQQLRSLSSADIVSALLTEVHKNAVSMESLQPAEFSLYDQFATSNDAEEQPLEEQDDEILSTEFCGDNLSAVAATDKENEPRDSVGHEGKPLPVALFPEIFVSRPEHSATQETGDNHSASLKLNTAPRCHRRAKSTCSPLKWT